jgi:hypothetical protein
MAANFYHISLESFLQEAESRFVIVPMTARVSARAMNLSITYPKDPADRRSNNTGRGIISAYCRQGNPTFASRRDDLVGRGTRATNRTLS